MLSSSKLFLRQCLDSQRKQNKTLKCTSSNLLFKIFFFWLNWVTLRMETKGCLLPADEMSKGWLHHRRGAVVDSCSNHSICSAFCRGNFVLCIMLYRRLCIALFIPVSPSPPSTEYQAGSHPSTVTALVKASLSLARTTAVAS